MKLFEICITEGRDFWLVNFGNMGEKGESTLKFPIDIDTDLNELLLRKSIHVPFGILVHFVPFSSCIPRVRNVCAYLKFHTRHFPDPENIHCHLIASAIRARNEI